MIFIRANPGRTPAMKTAFASAVAEEVAQGLGRGPEDVWIYYEETPLENIWYRDTWSASRWREALGHGCPRFPIGEELS